MNTRKMFGAFVIVFIVLACLGINRTNAQSGYLPPAICYASGQCNEGEAFQACNQAIRIWASLRVGNNSAPYKCVARRNSAADGFYSIIHSVTGNSAGLGEVMNSFLFSGYCASIPSFTTTFLPPSGSLRCSSGCLFVYRQNADETSIATPTGDACDHDYCTAGTFWNGYLGVCQPIEPDCPDGHEKVDGICKPENQCPDGMVAVLPSTPGAIVEGSLYCKPSGNECPAGNIKSPTGQCLPGEGQCAQGEARGKDGTCKRDEDGDGEPDAGEDEGDTKETFGGGDSCDSPPSCSGSPVLCGQARIQWRIDCNTRKNRNVSGGTCDVVPVCTGEKCDAVEFNSLVMQWRTACASEKLAKGTGQGDGQPAWTKVSGDGSEGAGTDPGKPHRTVGLNLDVLDGGGFLGGASGACPKFGAVQLWKFGSVDLDQWPWICDFFRIVRVVLIGIGAFIAFGILAGRGN